jgi:light-regulated signal transduction histidine kinase (bacteriophytochrome)
VSVVLEQLIGNAWKFSAKAGRPRIEFGSRRNDGKEIYYVKDNGAGFDRAKADRLFKPFSKLHSAREFPGNGIGLAIVKRAVERHGGRVWAEGEAGKGATFYFSLG